MTQFIRWMAVLTLVWLAVGCKKKEAQVVNPRASSESEVGVWVDQTGITVGQIQREATRLFSSVPKNVPQDQMGAIQMRLLQQAVDNLVIRQLVKAEMERSNVLISREEIEQGKIELEKGLGEGHSLTMLIAEANLPMEELENNIRLDLFKNKVLKERLKVALDAITDETVRAYYDAHLEEFTQPEGRLVSHILVRVETNVSEVVKTERMAKAEGIRKALLEGADFSKLASEVSDCPSRSRGGVIGVVPKGRESKLFEDAIYGQKIGVIGEVVETPVGYHIILVTGEQKKKVFPFEEVQEQFTKAMKAREQQKITAEYIEDLKKKATIKLDGMLAAAADANKAKAAEGSAVPATETPSAVTK